MAKRAQKSGLTPDRIITAAAGLLNSGGVEGFSMRRLGGELGVEAMALYHHFPDKDAILDAVADWVLRQIELPPARGGWKARLASICRSIRRTGQQHPEAFRLLMTRRTKPASALPVMEHFLAALVESGLPPRRQIDAYHSLTIFLRGFALFEAEAAAREADYHLPGADVLAEFPTVRVIADKLHPINFDRQFEANLDALLAGFATYAGPR